MVTGTRPGRALAGRFVAGDTLDEAVPVAQELNQEGFLVSLDLLGEEVHDRESAIKATDEYVECLNRIAQDGLDSNISIKPTQLGLSIDEGLTFEAIDRLAERANEAGTTVTIDMEDSRYTEATVQLFEKAKATHGNLGIAIQSYLHRTPEDLSRLTPAGWAHPIVQRGLCRTCGCGTHVKERGRRGLHRSASALDGVPNDQAGCCNSRPRAR